MYHSAQSKNISIEDVYKELMASVKMFNQDSSIWNMTFPSGIIEDFMAYEIEKFGQNNQTQPPLNVEKKNEWKFLYFFYSLFNTQMIGDDLRPITFTETDWSTKTVGSFFVKNLIGFVEKCPSFEGVKLLRQLFTLPNQNLSLPLIAFLYSANDFKTHSFLSSDDFFDNDLGVEESLRSCISNVTSDVFSNEAQNFLTEKIKYAKYLQPSPCLDMSKYPQCSQYCNWHSRYFKEYGDEFITLMKYASPQRKLSLTSTLSEIELAKRLFGNHTMANLNHTIVPFSLVLFCYQRSKGFVGDDLGMYAKACNNFFPTPTDQGICLTRNMDIKEVIHTDKNYDSLFESNIQSSNEYLKEGTYGSKNILVAFTGASWNMMRILEQTNFRTENDDDEEILVKFHQSNEISHFFEDERLGLASPSLKLKAGMEYFVDIIPQVTKTTEGFKKMNIHQRNCKLQHEVGRNSIFKVYTQKNCKYECNVKRAEAACNCIPWDFMHKNETTPECDIFGRTCFYNAMDTLAESQSLCNHCMKECDYTIYETILTNGKSLLMGSTFGTRLFDTTKFGIDEPTVCVGDTAFCDYFWPNNGTTFIDKGLDKSYLSMNNIRYKVMHSTKATDLVIIHWRILKPQINVADAKYSLLDKFANFGGNFGIFAEITGCSFLGMINFLILLFKLICSYRQNQN